MWGEKLQLHTCECGKAEGCGKPQGDKENNYICEGDN